MHLASFSANSHSKKKHDNNSLKKESKRCEKLNGKQKRCFKYDNIFTHLFTFRARRAAKEAKEAPQQPAPEKPRVDIKKFVKIGRPGYKGNFIQILFAYMYYNFINRY